MNLMSNNQYRSAPDPETLTTPANPEEMLGSEVSGTSNVNNSTL